MSDINKPMENLINMLQSPKAGTRYEACEYLRVSPVITPDAIIALQNALKDPDASVVEAAQSALNVHIGPERPFPEHSSPEVSHPSGYPVWKYLWRIILGGLMLFSIEYFVFRHYIYGIYLGSMNSGNINSYYWMLAGILVVNLLVEMFIIFFPAWQEPKSLKSATLALGSCLLAIPLTIFSFHNFDNSLLTLLFPLSFHSLILSVIGVIWSYSEIRKGNLLNPKAKVANNLSWIALVVSFLCLIPVVCLLSFIISCSLSPCAMG